MSVLGSGILKGMAVTLKNFVGSYFDKERLTTNEYIWKAGESLPKPPCPPGGLAVIISSLIIEMILSSFLLSIIDPS